MIGFVVENERSQILMTAADTFTILEQEERFVCGGATIFLFEGSGGDTIDHSDSEEAEAASAQLEPQLGMSVILIHRQFMRIDYSIHMIIWLIVLDISELIQAPQTACSQTQVKIKPQMRFDFGGFSFVLWLESAVVGLSSVRG